MYYTKKEKNPVISIIAVIVKNYLTLCKVNVREFIGYFKKINGWEKLKIFVLSDYC